MYFLICLVDTIDPVKKFVDETGGNVGGKTKEVLKRIGFERQ